MNALTYDLVVGLGRSGLFMARFLKSLGRPVMATDIDGSKTDEAAALEALGIPTQVGYHDQDVFNQANLIIPSPGIPLTIPYLEKAAANGVKISGELDIFSQYNTTPVIAVTGSNGKTTTTRIIAEMAEASGLSCFVGGNIGTPLVEYLMAGMPVDLVVAEVSSFQLDLATTFTPVVGLLLNISPDHLDRYPDYKAYQDSKWSLFSCQDKTGTAIINKGIQNYEARTSSIKSRILPFQPQAGGNNEDLHIHFNGKKMTIPAAAFTALPGGHNRENISAAALAILTAGGSKSGICKGLETFNPLPHRMELVKEINGVKYYNDSKATNTDAVIRALEAFDAPTRLILGGREKDTDFTQLIPALDQVKQILAIGEAADHILKALGTSHKVTPCKSMEAAITRAAMAATAGDFVLLSPACASFDMYENYEARGRDFTALVNGLETTPTRKKETGHG